MANPSVAGTTLPDSSRVLSATYLEKHNNKNDILRRLRNVVQVLQEDEDVEADSPDFPGLAGLAATLVQPKFLDHRDKEVRLFTVLACLELFATYAPDAPWDEREVFLIFSQMIRQLANLSHCTSPSQPLFSSYLHILQLLAQVKIGVVLVDFTKTLEGSQREEAMEMLAELIRTLLSSVRIEHPPEVGEYAQEAITACLDEYDLVPISILDEILLTVGQGPTIMVTNPAAVEAAAMTANAKKKGVAVPQTKPPPSQVEQVNPSYVVAASVIRKTVDRQSTPIANLLNGLLNGDPHIVEQSSILVSATTEDDSKAASAPFAPKTPASADVYAIVYELHRISPQVLTTVIGTVSNSLSSLDTAMRLRVVQLLGRLFYAPSSNIAMQFRPCLREWMGRCSDIDAQVRLALAKALVTMLANIRESDIVQEVSLCLVQMLDNDPSLEVRSQIINSVCDLVYKKTKLPSISSTGGDASHLETISTTVPARLLQAIGSRVHSKIKSERKDAVTGLSQLYFRQYVQPKLHQLEASGDEVDVQLVLEVIHETCDLDNLVKQRSSVTPKKRRSKAANNETTYDDEDDRYSWIPRKVFECVCYTDAADPDMRTRVFQIVDDVLLGSELSESKKMTPYSRAVGLAFILDSLREGDDDLLGGHANGNAYKFMVSLLTQRANLQRALNKYVDARSALKSCKSGSEEALMANARAMELLETVAAMTAPPSTASDLSSVLENLHAARDKHIFRILATIANPTHTMAARVRAFEELPKRTKSLGDATCAWVKSLARRCAMGDFLNKSIIQQCIALAQECFHGNDIPASIAFLSCVKLASTVFPALCGDREGFNLLIEMFMECRAARSGKKKKEIDQCGMVTALCSILAAAAPSRVQDSSEEDEDDDKVGLTDDDFQKELTTLCTSDGTAEQARYAVYIRAALLNPGQLAPGVNFSNVAVREHETFGSLVRTLTASSRLTLTAHKSENTQIISALTAFAAIADCAPSVFSDKTGDKALRFARETVLLGRNPTSQDAESHPESENESENDDDEDGEATTPASTSSRRGSAGKLKHTTPVASRSLLDDSTLSIACRRACASIEFLVSYIRAAVLRSIAAGTATMLANDNRMGKENDDGTQKKTSTLSALLPPSADIIRNVFELLVQIIQDNGLPPSDRDRRICKARQDRAAVRHSAAVHLLRLCDPRLNLERSFLTAGMWHVLGSSLLDEERVVRDGVLEELSNMLTAKGKFDHDAFFKKPAVTNLRFLALIALSADGEHSDNSSANGGAANVGKRSQSVKVAALHCVKVLRKACEQTLTQCKALGRTQEQNFEKNVKMLIMPEYCVPYAIHLLCFRRETPSAGGTAIAKSTGLTQTQNESEEPVPNLDDENQHRVLRKRLKLLFEPLVQSLGDNADNISFLLRMTEALGNLYIPQDVSRDEMKPASKSSPAFSLGSQDENSLIFGEYDEERSELSAAKLKTICLAAREVLLGFVKKDVNLMSYPGSIQLPVSLFKRSPSSASLMGQTSVERGPSTSTPSATPNAKRIGGSKSSDIVQQGSKKKAKKSSFERVAIRSSTRSSRVRFSPEINNEDDFGGISPIPTSHSPMERERGVASEEKTAGPTPPSILQTTTPRSITQESSGDNDRESRSSILSSKVEDQDMDREADQSDDEMPVDDQPLTSFDNDDDDNDDGHRIQPTSETQSSFDSNPSPLRNDIPNESKVEQDDSRVEDDGKDEASSAAKEPNISPSMATRRARLPAKKLFAEDTQSPAKRSSKRNAKLVTEADEENVARASRRPNRKGASLAAGTTIINRKTADTSKARSSRDDSEPDRETKDVCPSLDESDESMTFDGGIPKMVQSRKTIQSQSSSEILRSSMEDEDAQPVNHARRANIKVRPTASSKDRKSDFAAANDETKVTNSDEDVDDDDDDDDDEDLDFEPKVSSAGLKRPTRRVNSSLSSARTKTSRETQNAHKKRKSADNDDDKKRRKTASAKVHVTVNRSSISQFFPNKNQNKSVKRGRLTVKKRETVERDEFDFDGEGGDDSSNMQHIAESKPKRSKPTKGAAAAANNNGKRRT